MAHECFYFTPPLTFWLWHARIKLRDVIAVNINPRKGGGNVLSSQQSRHGGVGWRSVSGHLERMGDRFRRQPCPRRPHVVGSVARIGHGTYACPLHLRPARVVSFPARAFFLEQKPALGINPRAGLMRRDFEKSCKCYGGGIPKSLQIFFARKLFTSV